MYAWMIAATVAEIMIREWLGLGFSPLWQGLKPVAAATTEG